MPQKVQVITEPIHLDVPGASVRFYPQFFSPEESDRLFTTLYETIAWKQEQLKFFGKPVDQPRLTAWYGDPGTGYTYSGLHLKPLPWVPVLTEIREALETAAQSRFNSVLLNLYRDQRDTVGWHADDERELGPDPIIGSVSFGATRPFQLKHRKTKGIQRSVDLTHGSLLLMGAGTQQNWLHRIPRSTKEIGPRINLTFRHMLNALPINASG